MIFRMRKLTSRPYENHIIFIFSVGDNDIFDNNYCINLGNLLHSYCNMLKYQYLTQVFLNLRKYCNVGPRTKQFHSWVGNWPGIYEQHVTRKYAKTFMLCIPKGISSDMIWLDVIQIHVFFIPQTNKQMFMNLRGIVNLRKRFYSTNK